MRISAVINTRNEAKNIVRCLKSVVSYVDEIIVVDMESSDQTVELVRKYTEHIYSHANTGYVEPARNFALQKATGDWLLLIDADEVLPSSIGDKLKRLAEHGEYSYYRIPRKNIIFNKWIRHSGWWPDYQIRFFQKDKVNWNDEIHSIPETTGKGTDLIAEEKNAFIHYHYDNIEQYLERLNRYTSQEAKQLLAAGRKFNIKDLMLKPANEFLTRFFIWEGYKDGLHGLVLSLLQSFSFLITQLKAWQNDNFEEQSNHDLLNITYQAINKFNSDFKYWFFTQKSQSEKGWKLWWNKLRAKLKI